MARLLYYGILGVVDDRGRAKAAAAYLHGQVFWGRPRPLAKVEAALAELVKGSILRVYTAQGGRYLEIVGWQDPGEITHQRIDKPQHSTIPGPSTDHSENDSRTDTRAILGSVVDGNDKENTGQEQGQEQGAFGGPIASGPAQGQVIKSISDDFQARFVTAYGKKPSWGPVTTKQIKNLLKQHSAEEIRRRIEILFESPPSWLEPPFTFGTLIAQFDRLVVAIARKGPIAARNSSAPTDFFGALDDARDELKKKSGES